jgi:hypothetical protein
MHAFDGVYFAKLHEFTPLCPAEKMTWQRCRDGRRRFGGIAPRRKPETSSRTFRSIPTYCC